MIHATDAEIAWAAGLFEGEGTACVVTRKSLPGWSCPHVAIAMTDQEPIERFARIMGFGTQRVGKPHGNGGRKPLYWWKASRKCDVPKLAVFLPWLSPRRQEQLQAAIDASVYHDPAEYRKRGQETRRRNLEKLAAA